MLHDRFDFLIIGSGLAGLYSAYYASRFGKVAIFSKTGIDISNSYLAQGGIAVVTNADDFPQYHLEDTLLAGRGLCDYTPVSILVNEGPERIQELIDLGMQFDTENGELALGLEGGHHRRRVLHAGSDSTGKEISDFLIAKIKNNPDIEIFENQVVFQLLVQDKTCYGVRSWNVANQTEMIATAPTTLLAMGGASAVYHRTTNPESTVGDGIAIAYRSGASIADMEFIQFHPTSFYSETGKTFLISEAVRGEGAYLVNHNGERFMQNVHELAELAPRDVVSRSIFAQMQESGETHMFLDLTHLNPEKIQKRFPSIYRKCKEFGIDMCRKIPVAPAAHYMVGGIRTGINGETNISRLYACGELASTGMMGANRLASNSLSECLVFGKRAIDYALKKPKQLSLPKFQPVFFHANESLRAAFIDNRNEISRMMTQKVGIVRDDKGLQEALNFFEQKKSKFPFEKHEYYSLCMENLILVCSLITRAALARKESRGVHVRKDFKEEKMDFLNHFIQQIDRTMCTIPVETFKEN